MKFKKILNDSLSWLKYFCFNFFNNKYAREGAKRSSANVIVGVIIAAVLICGGMTVGYNTSFDKRYESANKFKQFVYTALKDEDISVKDGKLTLSGKDRIETFSDEDSPYSINGYQLVVDTRPAGEAYDDFTIVCTDDDKKEISYDNYYKLSESDKMKYSLSLKYSGKFLDTQVRQEEYRAHLDKVSDKDGGEYKAGIANDYNIIKERESRGELTGYDLYNAIYRLYARSYYPSFDKIEKYASVPTLRSYYISEISQKNYGKFLILFDELCFFSFVDDDGIAVSFSGGYPDGEAAVSGEDAIDNLLCGAFYKSAARNFLVFVSDIIVSIIIFVIIALLVSFSLVGLCSKQKLEYSTSTGIFNILGGFLPVSAIVAFVFGVWMPYFLSIKSAYLAVRLIFLGIVLIRFGVLLAMDIIKVKKETKNVPPAERVQDPFEVSEENNNDEQ